MRSITIHDAFKDYDAVMSSREHLWSRFGVIWGWPSEDMTIEQNRRAYERGRREVEDEMRNAAAIGDTEAYDAAKAKRDKLDTDADEVERPAPAATPRTPQMHPDTQAWIDGNDWFRNNGMLRQVMAGIHENVQRTRPELSVTGQLEEAKRLVMKKFPEEFGLNPERRKPASVNPSTGSRGNGRNGHTFADLPMEAQKAYERFAAMVKDQSKGKKELTKDQYLAEYEW